VLATVTASTARLWDVQTRTPLGRDLGDAALSVAFSPDGRTVAFGVRILASVVLWDVGSRRPIVGPLSVAQTAAFHFDEGVYGLAFSPDGRILATARPYDHVRLWQGFLWHDLADLSGQVCGLVAGDLTEAELDEYAPRLPYRAPCRS
jgi:WD40 repeat protein